MLGASKGNSMKENLELQMYKETAEEFMCMLLPDSPIASSSRTQSLTGSIILRNGRLSELIAQLQELLKGVDEVELAPYKYDSSFLLLRFSFLLSLPFSS